MEIFVLSGYCLRRIAEKEVKAVKEGKTQSEVAKILGVTLQIVEKWVKKDRQVGAKALKATRKGWHKGGKLHP